MSDYLELTNDDVDDLSIMEDDISNLDDDEIETEENHELMTKEKVYHSIYNDKYITTNKLTKYEKAKIIGVRAQMIADGAGTLVDPGDLIDPVKIAHKELDANKCPLILRRPIPSRNPKKPNYEYRKVSDLN